MREHARRAYDYLGAHPYRTTFFRGLRLGMLRTTVVKLLVGDFPVPGLVILAAAMGTEWIMSRSTSGAVGFRSQKHHLKHVDNVWATGAMIGLLLGVILVHVTFHTGRVDPAGCLLRWGGGTNANTGA